ITISRSSSPWRWTERTARGSRAASLQVITTTVRVVAIALDERVPGRVGRRTGRSGTKFLTWSLSAHGSRVPGLNRAFRSTDRTYMRLRPLLATVAAGAVLGSTALSAAP